MGRRAKMYPRRVFVGIKVFGYVLTLGLVVWAGTATAENSAFYGTFDMTLSGTEPHPWTEARALRIGDDETRMREEGYLHIPASGSPVTNAWTKEDGAPVSQVITIAEDTITVDQREECLDNGGVRFVCLTKDLQFAFSSGYAGAVISGFMWNDDPEENQGVVTGSLTRVEDGGGGGGGCFIGAAARAF
jgi:hypothetical protein